MEIEPEKFRPQYKVHKIFRVGGGVKTRVGRGSGNNKNLFLGLNTRRRTPYSTTDYSIHTRLQYYSMHYSIQYT